MPRDTGLNFIVGVLALCISIQPVLCERTMVAPRSPTRSDVIASVRVHKNILNARRFSVSTRFGRLLATSDASRPRTGRVPTQNGRRTTNSRSGKIIPENQLRFDDYVVSKAFRGSGRFNVKHAIFSGADDRAYVISRQGGRTVMKTVQKDRLPSCGAAQSQAKHSHGPETRHLLAADGEVSNVDAAIFYSTEAFRAAGGSTAAMAAEAASVVEMANQTFAQSKIANMGLKLAYVGQLGSELRKGHEELLSRVQDPSDGFYDEIHAIRRQVSADVVTYMVTAEQYCGLGYIFRNPSDATFREFAFNTVNTRCLANHSYVHEVGHNMGLDHNREDAGGDAAYPFAFGYRFRGVSGAQWRTVMAYAPGSRINYLSNPQVSYDGELIGRHASDPAGGADNARALSLTAPIVARFVSATDSALAPSAPVPSFVPSFIFSKPRARLRGNTCQISAGLTDSEGAPAEGVFAALVDSANQDIYAEKFSNQGKIVFRLNTKSVRRIKFQIAAESNALSSTFHCPQPKKRVFDRISG
jgi:Metallo-peptidase family M12